MMSDATGNRWEANTDGGTRSSDPGLIRFVGALWPGEPAWQLDVDLFRSGGFESAEVWKPSAMRLSAPSELQNLDLAWELSGVRLRLVALGGPQADHPMPYLWLCKYWGEEEKNRVVSLAVEMVAPGGRWHSVIVKAEDEQGRRVELLNHLDADRRHQAALLKPEEGARELRMEWSVQPIHTARFVARPEFVEPEAKGDASGPKQP
jgi:hypothetical protein